MRWSRATAIRSQPPLSGLEFASFDKRNLECAAESFVEWEYAKNAWSRSTADPTEEHAWRKLLQISWFIGNPRFPKLSKNGFEESVVSPPAINKSPDVLIIGAGAGGLSAAVSARETGAEVLVLDERRVAGGQFYKQVSSPNSAPLDSQQRAGAKLVASAKNSGARIITGAEVWGCFDGPTIHAISDQGAITVRPRSMIVATGAFDRPIMVPGWTLPGVMTTGAAQTVWRSYRVLPGKRIAVAGNGPLNFQVAKELMQGGAKVEMIAEAAMSPYLQLWSAAQMLRWDPRLTIAGLATLTWLASKGVRPLFGTRLTKIESAEARLTVSTVSGTGITRTAEVDALCMNYGFLPQNEILRLLGAKMNYDKAGGQLVPIRSDTMETTVPGVYAVGDCCGLGGAPLAEAEGLAAGAAAARSALSLTETTAISIAAHRTLNRHRRFQSSLWKMFHAEPQRLEDMPAETLVCRCEEVTASVVREAAVECGAGVGPVKRVTRVGMGRCQGRYCGTAIAQYLSRQNGQPLTDRSFFTPRPPVKPVSIGEMPAFLNPEALVKNDE